jgi:hypothetical protein
MDGNNSGINHQVTSRSNLSDPKLSSYLVVAIYNNLMWTHQCLPQFHGRDLAT